MQVGQLSSELASSAVVSEADLDASSLRAFIFDGKKPTDLKADDAVEGVICERASLNTTGNTCLGKI